MDRAVLILYGDLAADGFKRDAGERSADVGVAFHVPRRDRAIGILRGQIPADALGCNAAEARLGVSVAADVGEPDPAISGRGANTLRDVGSFDGPEGGLQDDAPAGGAHRDFSVRRFGIQRAADRVQVDIAEGIPDGHRTPGCGAAFHPTVAGPAVHTAFDLGEGDVAEAVGDLRGPADRGNLHVAVVVVQGQVAADVADLGAAERGGYDRRGRIGQRYRAIAAD